MARCHLDNKKEHYQVFRQGYEWGNGRPATVKDGVAMGIDALNNLNRQIQRQYASGCLCEIVYEKEVPIFTQRLLKDIVIVGVELHAEYVTSPHLGESEKKSVYRCDVKFLLKDEM